MSRAHTLSEDLKLLLLSKEVGSTHAHHKKTAALTLGELISAIGDRGFGLALLITSLPSALPIPAPGYSTPFGVLLVLLSLQMLFRQQAPWLPAWAHKREIPKGLAESMLKGLTFFLTKVERFIKPRLSFYVRGSGYLLSAVLVFIMGTLMIIPMPGTNTAPAGVIFLIAISLIEEDGLFLALATLLGILATALYLILFAVIFYYGAGGISEALEYLREWF
jgi:hypothetical protein